MNKFRFYWRDGTTQVAEGETITEAFTNAGYGASALNALDFYDPNTEQRYTWDRANKRWVK